MPDVDLGVSVALLTQGMRDANEKLDDLLEHARGVDAMIGQHDVALEAIRGSVRTECARLDGRIERVQDGQRLWAGLLGSLAAIGSAIAGWLGTRN